MTDWKYREEETLRAWLCVLAVSTEAMLGPMRSEQDEASHF